mmetsp:Transcript_25345/g.31175  ORF Transcript_25345/g.31175 Transcript_25345/m.31175 type:complete len:248 (-) Transcript_25345:342-1085(-)
MSLLITASILLLQVITPSLVVVESFATTSHVVRRSSSSQLNMALTLYGSMGSRSPLVNWAAYELNVPLEMGDLGENPHPFGQIPSLKDDGGTVVFESGAILNYLQRKSDQNLDDKTMGFIFSWISWANASLDPICFLETPDGKVYDTGLKKPNKRIDTLDKMLSTSKFLMGETFTTADVAVASYLLYVPLFFRDVDLSRWPNVVRYMKDCVTRPAYGQAFTEQTQSLLLGLLENMGNGGDKKFLGLF